VGSRLDFVDIYSYNYHLGPSYCSTAKVGSPLDFVDIYNYNYHLGPSYFSTAKVGSPLDFVDIYTYNYQTFRKIARILFSGSNRSSTHLFNLLTFDSPTILLVDSEQNSRKP
jgi:hypothetical protein